MTPEWGVLATLMLLALSRLAFAENGCLQSASTELERLHCQVVAQGGGQGLPSQADFRRNDPKVQALLLRRPAQRLGLTVPEAPSDSAQAKPAASEATTPAPEPRPVAVEPKADPAPEPVEPAAARSNWLAECRLRGERIACRDRQFELALNRPNAELAPGVLTAQNRLDLPPFKGDRANEQQVRRYLSNAYDRYIPKMLSIGLGANTMSFTAFHNAFHTLESGGVDFAERMEQTYELLKQDKRNLAVQARYHEQLPEDLALCEPVGADIIVCDNVATNWVFVDRTR